MSDYTVETIDLTEVARLRVEYDQSPSNPRKEWDHATGFAKIEGRGDSNLIDVESTVDDSIGIAAAYERFGDAGYVYVGQGKGYNGGPYEHRTWIDAERLTVRWARVFHGLHLEYDSEHGGFWFVATKEIAENVALGADWDKLERQAEIIASDREEYRQWANGEVYGVILERLQTQVTYLADRKDEGFEIDTTHPPVVEDIWDDVDSLWSCYLDDDYTAQHVASEHFDLSSLEWGALGLPGRPLSIMTDAEIEDVRLAEEDVPLIEGDRLTTAGEIYFREVAA